MIDSDQALVSGKKNIPRWPDIMNPGRFAPITCSPRKVSRFSPLNRYYIIIDEVFFDNFLVIIYLLVVATSGLHFKRFKKNERRQKHCRHEFQGISEVPLRQQLTQKCIRERSRA
jgi:hypothetical protein